MHRIRAGIIGLGMVGKVHAENIINHVRGINLVKAVDMQHEAAEQWLNEKNYDISVSDDPASIFDDASIDCVLICSAETTHADYIILAAKSGKHIFCEKPLDHDLKKAKIALNTASDASVSLQMGFSRRFDRGHLGVYQCVRRGDLGQQMILRLSSKSPAPPDRRHFAENEKDLIFFNSSIHDFDMLRFISGSEATELYVQNAHLGQWGFQTDAYDTAVMLIKLENSAIAIIENSWGCRMGHDQRIEVMGFNGTAISTNPTADNFSFSNERGTMSSPIFAKWIDRYHDAFIAEMRSFCDCVKNGTSPIANGNDGLQALTLSYAARLSSQRRQPISLDEVRSLYGI